MSLVATEPASIAKVLDASIKLFVASFKKLIGILSILAVLYVVTGLLTLKLQPAPSAPPEATLELLSENLSLIIGVTVVTTLLSLVLYAALIYRLHNVAIGREDSFVEAITVGLKAFPATCLGMILYVNVVIIGYVLLIIPGIILTLSLGFYLYFIVVDAYRGYRALKASHALVWGCWWRTVAVFTVPGVLWMAVMLTFGILAGILGPGNQVLMQIVINLLSMLITSYFFALGYVQFQDLKLRKSGNDLASRLAE